jgi:hypothetical protein
LPEAVALLLTILIESVLAFVLAWRLGWGNRLRVMVAAAAGVGATHFFAWSGILRLDPAIGYGAAVALVETGVMLVKSGIYRALVPLPWRRALVLALILNSASTATGLLYYAVAL